jgi:hypothetical protein
MRESSQKGTYMLIRDTIGRFAQNERSEGPITGPSLGEELIRLLTLESNEVPGDVILPDRLRENCQEALLHILHAGWLDGNYAWCLERFWYENYPNGLFPTRFEVLYGGKFGLSRLPAGTKHFPCREYSVQPLCPTILTPLRVAAEFVSSVARAMLWDDPAIVDIILYGRQGPCPEQSANSLKIFAFNAKKSRIRIPYVLLTLKKI